MCWRISTPASNSRLKAAQDVVLREMLEGDHERRGLLERVRSLTEDGRRGRGPFWNRPVVDSISLDQPKSGSDRRRRPMAWCRRRPQGRGPQGDERASAFATTVTTRFVARVTVATASTRSNSPMPVISLRRWAATSTSVATIARRWSGTTGASGLSSDVRVGEVCAPVLSSGIGEAVEAVDGVRGKDLPPDRAVLELLAKRCGSVLAPAGFSGAGISAAGIFCCAAMLWGPLL